jgi:DNA-binding NarL/FixJ family response regulator
MIPAANAAIVWSTSRSCGSETSVCRWLFVTNSASDAPSRPMSRISPASQAWKSSLSACRMFTLVGRSPPADKPGTVAERILLVDDHPLTRSALSGLLMQHGFDVVGEAEDGGGAVERAAELGPDLILLDLSMPGVDGLTALPLLREAAPQCEVVVLTASGTEENLLGAIRAGAAGYLLKSEPPERIVGFLRGVANGEAALSGAVARRLVEQVRANGGRTGVPDSIAAVLSARELEVLLLLDEHLTTDEIAKRLYISEHTVRSHVKSLLRKLGVSSRREALEALSTARMS